MTTEIITLSTLAQRINETNRNAEESAKKAIFYAIECGDALIDAKALVKHGEWLTWLKSNCEVSERTAQNYMKLATEYPQLEESKAQRVADLSIREAIKALSEPKAQRVADLETTEDFEITPSWLPKGSDLATVDFDQDMNSLDFDWLLVQQSEASNDFYYVAYLLGSNIEFSIKPFHKSMIDIAIHSMLPGKHTRKSNVSELDWGYVASEPNHLKDMLKAFLPEKYKHLKAA